MLKGEGYPGQIHGFELGFLLGKMGFQGRIITEKDLEQENTGYILGWNGV